MEEVAEVMEEAQVKGITEEENATVEVEPKTGVSFPIKLDDGKELNSIGLRRKKLIVINITAFAFGLYADNVKLKEHLKPKFGTAPPKPTKELYDAVINSEIGLVLRAVIVLRGLTTGLVRKGFEEELVASIKKHNGGQRSGDPVKKVVGDSKDYSKISAVSVLEVTRLPQYVFQFKVNGELISKVESELVCRAYFDLYLGEEPYDEQAKERFGNSLLSLF